MRTPASARLVRIADAPGFVNPLARVLWRAGYTVAPAADGSRALATLQAAPYALLLWDVRMPELEGPALYTLRRQQSPHRCPPVVFRTGEPLRPTRRAFLEQCGPPGLAKPCSALQIRQGRAQVLGG
jgi:CheY-like chemotaxis protein